jgi:manganese/zinc/iron transport system substrate-binding protein
MLRSFAAHCRKGPLVSSGPAVTALFGLMLALPAAPPAFATGGTTLSVVATTGMVADVITSIGGSCVSVTTLIADGSDPHSYLATPSDVTALRDAGLIVHNGLNLEGRLSDVLAALARTRPVLALAEAGTDEALRLTETGGAVDPHVWMDARLWGGTAAAAVAALSDAKPDCAADFESNAKAYAARAEALHGWIEASIATIPAPQRRLVTAHDAFGYFSRAYSMPVSAIQGISTETEAAIADIEAVAAVIADKKVPAVFVESTISPRTMEAVIEAVRAKGADVTIGGTLLSDAMGAEGTPEGTWIGMMRANAIAITEALGGTVAPWPDDLSDWAVKHGVTP